MNFIVLNRNLIQYRQYHTNLQITALLRNNKVSKILHFIGTSTKAIDNS